MVSLSLADIDPLKASLQSHAPTLRPSHRLEAAARGLGHSCYAALTTALDHGPAACVVENRAFADFVVDRGGAGLPESVLSDALEALPNVRRQVIAAVMAREPALCAMGYRTYDPQRSPRDNRLDFERSRAELLHDGALEEFGLAISFLKTREKAKSIQRVSTSYGYKHQAEAFHKAGDHASGAYISNGVFIAAAEHLGFRLQRVGSTPNAYLNIAEPKAGRQRSRLAAPLRGSKPKRAWRNLMVAGINAGLAQGLFGRAKDDNRWLGDQGAYAFSFDGLPARAWVRDAGFGELSIFVAVQPTARALETGAAFNSGLWAGEGFASGYLEREDGFWLQTPEGPYGAFRTALLDRISAHAPVAAGYADKGPMVL
jgi:hypothetical protein